MFRRRRRAFSGKRFREPLMWDRFPVSNVSAVSILDAATAVTVWDPTSITAGSQDLRLTMRRLMLGGGLAFHGTIGSTGAAGDVFSVQFGLGVYLSSSGDVRNPLLTATADKQTDWLWLSQFILSLTLTGAITTINFAGNVLRNVENQLQLIDIRTKRKVDQEQQLLLSIAGSSLALDNTIGVTLTGLNTSTRFTSSVLYSRTGR